MKKAIFCYSLVFLSLFLMASHAIAGAWLPTTQSLDMSDSSGNPNADGVIDDVIYTNYRADGFPLTLEVDAGNDGDIDSITYETYNDAGYLIKDELDSDNDGNIDSITTHTYDENGFLTVISNYDGDWKLESLSYATYDAKGNMIKFEMDSNADSEIDSVSYYTYDEKCRKTKEEKDEGADGAINSIEYYTYDDNCNNIKTEVDSDNDGDIDSTTEFAYDEQGTVIYIKNVNITSFELDAGIALPNVFDNIITTTIEENQNTYDEHGNLIKIESNMSLVSSLTGETHNSHGVSYVTYEYFESAEACENCNSCGCCNGDSTDTGDGTGTDDGIGETYKLYFPHVASSGTWETEICIINPDNVNSLSGTLTAYDNTGQQVATKNISLASHARRQIVVGDEFVDHTDIGYLVLESDSEDARGYNKFYIDGQYRAAIPATTDVNTGDIYIAHIASNSQWWTGISILNTTAESKTITIEFNNGQTRTRTLAGNEHQVFTIKSLFDGIVQPGIQSAVIKNGEGIIGLNLFGSKAGSGNNYLSGVLIEDDTASSLFYPHIASNTRWWTGLVAYNPSMETCYLTITPYMADGTALNPQVLSILGKEKYIGTAAAFSFPVGTAWFKIDASIPVTGFELFGTKDGNQLGGYTGVGIENTTGVFSKVENGGGWTGIAFVNSEPSPAMVTITAYTDSGVAIATEEVGLNAYEKVVELIGNLFVHDVSNAAYIAYSSTRKVVGFQLNGSADGMLLDGLPGM